MVEIKSDLSSLLEDKTESFYWIGFLLADGSLCTENRLSLVISEKDDDHFDKFLKYISYSGSNNNGWKCQDPQLVSKIKNKFGFKRRKSYNPPQINYKKFDNDLKFSLYIGFIDGDGRITNPEDRTGHLTIKLHKSWLDFLKIMVNDIYEVLDYKLDYQGAFINNRDYAQLNISDSKVLKSLKLKSQNLNLPLLKRKWRRINLDYMSQQERGLLNEEKVLSFLKEGRMQNEIAKNLDLAESTISRIKKRLINKGKWIK